MRQKLTKVPITLFIILMAATCAVRGQGTTFTYQGHLSDTGLSPSGNYDMQFVLFDAASGGSPTGPTNTLASLAVSNGIFNASLDFGSAAFPGGTRWLQIAVRTNGSLVPYTTLQPRQPVTPAPYAITAANLSGILPDSNLSTNIARLTADQTFTGVAQFNNVSNSFTGGYAGNGGGLTNVPGTFRWEAVGGTYQQASPNTGYLLTYPSETTVALPTSPAIGDTIRLAGQGPWKLAQNAGQFILLGNLPLAGITWTPRDSTRNWNSVASSADGTKLVAVVNFGQVYTSGDSGLTWIPRDSVRYWNWVASSADGTKLVGVVYGGQIYTSPDSGATWSPKESTRNWWAVTSSADGTKLAAVVFGGQIYTSADSGGTWTPRESSRNWNSIACSADGSKLVATVLTGQIYTSADAGVTWTPRESNRSWSWVASSGDGSSLAAVAPGFPVYTSSDSGVTWTPRGAGRSWASIASSADGSKLVATVSNGQIYTSSDAGLNWTPHDTNRGWSGLASSVDGSKLVATVYGGQIYTSSPAIPPGIGTITFPGTAGHLSGGQSTAVELMYTGNNQFLPISYVGTFFAY